jgi:hypothetical protein
MYIRRVTDQTSNIAAAILRLTAERGPDRSICPSEVARDLTDDWRPLLGPVRREAARLAESGRIDILRKGKPIAPADLRGVIRLRARPPERE